MAKLLAAVALAALAFSTVVRAEDIEEEGGVLVLTKDNFDEAVAKYNPLLVEFYAPWCGHCKKLAPEYEKAAKTLAPAKMLAKVDATIENELAQKFGIQGFPTLKFFRGDASNPFEYNGPREAAGIVSWLKKKSGPATTEVGSASAAKAFADANEVAILGFFKAGSAAAKAFNDVAAGNDELAFGVSASDEARAAYGVPAGVEAIVAINRFPGQENTVKYTGSLTDGKAIGGWAEANSLPLVIPFTQDSAPKIFRGGIKTHFLLFADSTASDYETIVSSFREVAATGAGRLLFVTVDPNEESAGRVISYFGIAKADMPTAVIVTMPEGEAMKKFMMPAAAALDAATLSAFLADYEAGKVSPFLKSEEPSAEDLAGPVKVVVGKSFKNIALDSDKDVLLEFYAPWCGHCKSLEPIYKQLGERFAAVESVVIAKMDATANEVDYPGVNVRGFPTILLFKAGPGPKKVVEYDGARDLAGFTKFLQEKAGKAFTLEGVPAEEASGELDL